MDYEEYKNELNKEYERGKSHGLTEVGMYLEQEKRFYEWYRSQFSLSEIPCQWTYVLYGLGRETEIHPLEA